MKVLILWAIIFIEAIICLILKKKIRLISTLFLVTAVTFFSLLTPEGKVILALGKFHITEGALLSGLFKGGIFVFLQLLSKILISSKIKLPGKAGNFINSVFAIYEKLTEGKFLVKDRDMVTLIDDRLTDLWQQESDL